MNKFIALLLIFTIFSAPLLFSQEAEPIQTRVLTKENATNINSTEAFKEELQINIEELDKKLKAASFSEDLYKGLAITGYSLTGLGLGLIILDALVATPTEDKTSQEKFNILTWCSIPIVVVGAAMSIAFRVLETRKTEEKLLVESEYYDLRSQLELLENQQANVD